ncbi:aKG-HExxH-type peptide beta-hydroxylase [Quisquiliibacterium transsilvanicum]|uniref:HEXXH motif-containing protein n=1 Tax=Quisquiliibacterium transsilvanicum TaxID=1549638 RepID=A0A7W8M9B2_9BURK|nr:HEXXH motif-containing protein [Quisquiliibacterium transsilvanicum]
MNLLDDFRFLPDGARARALDLRMRRSLAESLDHIAERCAGHVRFDVPAIAGLSQALARGELLPPSTFGLYSDLVIALSEDRLADAEALFVSLACEQPRQGATRVIPFDHPGLAAHRERYSRMMGCEPDSDFVILPPSPERAERFERELPQAMALMRAATPALADEFDALVSELVMVSGEERRGYQFDGGSCYMLWGALFLNVGLSRSPVALLEVLAHESAHMLLYGFAAEEALVLNDDDELYPSPLRIDERPMDGIYHATYVSARMHWAMGRLLESGLLDAAGRDEAGAAREADARNFAAGDEVVRRHGRLTATGDALMSAARAWMASGR